VNAADAWPSHAEITGFGTDPVSYRVSYETGSGFSGAWCPPCAGSTCRSPEGPGSVQGGSGPAYARLRRAGEDHRRDVGGIGGDRLPRRGRRL